MSLLANFYRTGTALLANGHTVKAGLPRFEAGKFGGSRALRLTSADAEACSVPAGELFDAQAGTIEAWIYLDATSDTRVILDARIPGDGFSATKRLVIFVNAGNLEFQYWNGAAVRTLSGGAIAATTWTHIGATWSSAGGKVYKNGLPIASHADIPDLAVATFGIGCRLDNTQQIGGRLGGLRFSRGVARSDVDILAAYNSNAQFVEDADVATVFSFDGTMRALLTLNKHQLASESSFLVPTTVTASTTAVDYTAANAADYEFPLLPHRSTNTAQTTITFDFGAVVNFRALFLALVNYEHFQLATSYDNSAYSDVPSSPFVAAIDDNDQYRKWGKEVSVSGRYVRLTIPAQLPDNNAAYFETPLVMFAGDLGALEVNPSWGVNFGVAYPYESGDASAHDEIQAKGDRYATLQIRGDVPSQLSAEWKRISALGNHRKFLLFQNLGKSQEVYLFRPDGSVQWQEEPGYNAFSMSWKEHIN